MAISKIKADVYSQRVELEGESLDELVGSIRRVGVLVPLIVVCDGEGFVLVAGHRRLAAAKRASLLSVPCIVRSGEASQAKEVCFAENFFRQDLSAIELAAGIKDALDEGLFSVDELAAALRRSAEWVRRQLVLLTWPPEVLEAIHNGKISVSAASNLAAVREGTYRAFLLRCAVDDGATARSTAAWLQSWEAGQPAAEAVVAEPVPGEAPRQPMVPQAPCIGCSSVMRTDELCYVPMCPACVRHLSNQRRAES